MVIYCKQCVSLKSSCTIRLICELNLESWGFTSAYVVPMEPLVEVGVNGGR